MNPSEYTALAMRTCSDKFHHEKVAPQILLALLIDFARAARAIDVVKRALFYGKDFHIKQLEAELPVELDYQEAHTAISEIGEPFWDIVTNPQALHGMLGMITEVGELVESFPGVSETLGSTANHYLGDEGHAIEEIGDISWYVAIFCQATGIDLGEAFERNIAKLRRRYPEKFEAIQALNRDLAAEAAALSQKE